MSVCYILSCFLFQILIIHFSLNVLASYRFILIFIQVVLLFFLLLYAFLYQYIQIVSPYALILLSDSSISGGIIGLGDDLFPCDVSLLFVSFSFIVSSSVVQNWFVSAAFYFSLSWYYLLSSQFISFITYMQNIVLYLFVIQDLFFLRESH